MSHSQATFPKNKQMAFLQLSGSNQLFEGCWAEDKERVVLIGLRRGEHRELRSAITRFAEKNGYSEDSCLGTTVSGSLKFIISSDPEKLRGFLDSLQALGVINDQEKTLASLDLGLGARARILHKHADMPLEVGAGI